jgi:hypothetical protein
LRDDERDLVAGLQQPPERLCGEFGRAGED